MSEGRISLGFSIATLLGWLGSVIGLIPTQGMSGREPVAELLSSFSFYYMGLYAISSGLGFSVLRNEPNGPRLWKRCVVGFVAGAGVTAVLLTVAFRSVDSILMMLIISPFVVPPLGGLIAILRFPKTATD